MKEMIKKQTNKQFAFWATIHQYSTPSLMRYVLTKMLDTKALIKVLSTFFV